MENKLTPELIEKARQSKSVGEILALAEKSGIELSEADAVAYLEQLRKSGELSDEELDNVSGGGCHYKDGRLVVTVGNTCDKWTCEKCGIERNYMGGKYHTCPDGKSINTVCNLCKYCTYEKALWLCNNPRNTKK